MTYSSPPLWERQDTDTPKSYEAFCIYRNMGANRSLQYAADIHYRKQAANRTQLTKWSSDHNWQTRVQAWDDYQDTKRRERNAERQKLIEENAYGDYEVLRDAIDKYKSDYSSIKFAGVKPADISNLIHMMKQVDDYARRAVGLPDKITESKTEVAGKDGGAMQHEVTRKVSAEDLTDDELASILAGLKASSSE